VHFKSFEAKGCLKHGDKTAEWDIKYDGKTAEPFKIDGVEAGHAAMIKEALAKTWELTQNKLDAKNPEARKSFGIFGKHYEAFFCWPGTLPFTPRKVKKGDQFEDRSMKFIVTEVRAEEAALEGSLKRGEDGEMKMSMQYSTAGHPAHLSMTLTQTGQEKPVVRYEAAITKQKP
jgi:hypothetical protein